jgi:hypothetical protein
MQRPSTPLAGRFRSQARALLLSSALLFCFASFFPPADGPVMAVQASIPLCGSIQRLRGNQQPSIGRSAAAAPAAAQDVVLVSGRVFPVQLGDPFLPAAALRASILGRARSDANGRFCIPLDPAPAADQPLTLLLVVSGGYFLNRFEGSGSFASFSLPAAGSDPPLLIDDRGATF